ncbi:MAG: septal ring lytic transglycosylase RlpA family protein, partial [Candidatus Accumulibacter sp.]|nr:septal ring lytic transglycosylase RlpA family protein [Accumulibacter sp.]
MIRQTPPTRDDLPYRRLATALLACFLAACGGQPTRSPDVAVQPGEAARPPGKIVRKPAVVQKRAGAYYKDDGPADEIPDNLDDIPDALPR